MAKRQPPPCAFCGHPADLLCDYVLGFAVGEWSGCDGETAWKVGRFDEFVPGKGLPCFSHAPEEMFTCDAPICEACAVNDGNVFFKGTAKVNGIVSIDFCPYHAAQPRWEGTTRPIKPEVAERARMLAWKLKVA